jgi:hypothetical protein
MTGNAQLTKIVEDTQSKLNAIKAAPNLRQVVLAVKGESYTPDEDTLPIVQPFEEGLRKYLEKNQIEPSIYNRFEYAGLLNSGLEFLTRALALRDDGQELSLRAFNSSLERWRAGKDIQLAQMHIDDANGDIYAQDSLAEALGKIEQLLMPHIRPESKHIEMEDLRLLMDYNELQARHASAISSRDALRAKQLTAQNGLQTMQILNEALQKRNEMPGHAMNFGERISTTKGAFLQNMTEAYSRLLAASEGLSVVFLGAANEPNSSLRISPFPQIVSNDLPEVGYVDTLMQWTRGTLFTLERINGFSHEYRVLLSMTALSKQASAKVFAASGHYTFTLNREDLSDLSNLRILHLAVHVMPPTTFSPVNEQTKYRAQHSSYSGSVSLPQQRAVNGSGVVPSLPRYYFGDATVYGEDPGKRLSSVAFRNAYPLGEWNITISNQSHSDIVANAPDDVWLELIVAGTRRLG